MDYMVTGKFPVFGIAEGNGRFAQGDPCTKCCAVAKYKYTDRRLSTGKVLYECRPCKIRASAARSQANSDCAERVRVRRAVEDHQHRGDELPGFDSYTDEV